ncbi:MAG: thioredoxin family protein, partial [Gemmataceae bacterium]|nr:thioredoxin family protein [Gemmataceae bacterium]
AVSKAAAEAAAGRKAAKPPAEYEAGLAGVQKNLVWADGPPGGGGVKPQPGLWGFLATAALWGLISLVTPCVFPMIPITVSIFLKQAHGSLGERLKLAGVYCLTIVLVLGVSAFALLKFMAWLSAHPATNLALGGLFLVLALSLFGMYELTLPNSFARRLQSGQAKGGVVGTVFGALAFTVISFTCVAPFLGGFAGISAADTGGSLVSMPTAREVFGGLAFAAAFAAPFFVLALVPGLLKALPRSGGWLDSVKVVMGFLELAAALKFFRTAELRLLPTPAYFTYDLVLAGWVAIAVACGLYLFNLYRLPHDEGRPNIGVPRLLFALLFVGLGVYLFPAMFRGADGKAQRPAGAVYAWVEAFLLPDTERAGTDLPDALDRARRSGRPVFVDFTGVTCTNCKYNEATVFTRPEVRALLDRFEVVQLYTDEVPASGYAADPGAAAREAEAAANRDFQIAAFKDSALPLYAVLRPVGDKVEVAGVYDEGKINDPARFAAFLKRALEAAGK